MKTPPSTSSLSNAQHQRGDLKAYQRYLDGMDSSMRQKVALVAAHLRSEGKVADMGMGSGTGSHALAALYPSLQVVGVDLDSTMVDLATQRYDLGNLEFVVGNIASKVFEDESLDAIINSSVLHHVTSFNGYRYEEAAKALAVQSAALKENGVILVRDFLAPPEATVYLDVPEQDGDGGDDAFTCSTAALFEKFACDFRLLSENAGFSYEDVSALASEAFPLAKGWRRYRVSLRHATEFILRKDYRRDYRKEAKEEYGYFTQGEFEEVFGGLGLRVLVSIPLQNPWIINNRYNGKFLLWDTSGQPLEYPATNFIIAGEKVKAGEGVRMREGRARSPKGFLQMEYYRHSESGAVMDLVRRPGRTLDILPWFEKNGNFFVLARSSYPRPILKARCREAGGNGSLDGATAAGYVTEPLLVMQSDRPLGTTVEETLQGAGVGSQTIRSFDAGTTYYPSPGGIEEIVTSALVEIDATFEVHPTKNQTGYGSAGRVIAIEAQQLLRSAQVGGLLDARLELSAYELLLQKEQPVGPWIGETLSLGRSDNKVEASSVAAVLRRDHRRLFQRAKAKDSRGFLELHCAEFEELDAEQQVLNRVNLEYVTPKTLSHNTLAVAVLCQNQEGLWIGVDDDDLPAAQSFTGNSELLVAPAWRVPTNISSMTPAKMWMCQRLEEEYGLAVTQTWSLGGRYHPSLGTTPEVVYPLAVEVGETRKAARSLIWLPLEEVVGARGRFADGHLRIVAMRAAHALGLLPGSVKTKG